MSEKRATQSAKEMNHLALGLCTGILIGLVMGSLALGLVFGIAIGGLLDTWDADRHA
jgi:putative exporter of polyketide antibiotics